MSAEWESMSATKRNEALTGRKRSRLFVEIDLDPIPGWGYVAEDHRALVERLLRDAVPHYNPSVRLGGEST